MRRPEEALHRSLVAQLRARLRYEPDTGRLIWRDHPRLAGKEAGTVVAKGYRQVQVLMPDGKKRGFKVHRVAWLLTHGVWPPDQIDHANGDPSDNRIQNLRLASNSLNMANRKRNSNSASPSKGVSFHKGAQRWRARIQVHGKRIHLGDFRTYEAAAIAYAEAAKKHFGEYARLS